MNEHNMMTFGLTLEKILLELRARAVSIPWNFWDSRGCSQLDQILQEMRMRALAHSSLTPPLNPNFSFISTPGLLDILRLSIKALALDIRRGIWNKYDARKDIFEITDEPVRKNARSVTVVCMKEALNYIGHGIWELRVKQYGEMMKLCDSERFYDQPAAAGYICSGVLVDKDVILTAAHFIHGTNIEDLRFLFDFVMVNPGKAITRFPGEKIYRAVKVLHRQKNPGGAGAFCSDWVMLKLDREVKGQEIVTLSQEQPFPDQPVYLLGYGSRLPLKYSPGKVAESNRAGHFMVHAEVFMGHSGAGLFSSENHQMMGLLIKTDAADFCWTAGGRAAVRYPNKDYESYGGCCTRIK